jgi:hypothetical protein
MNKKTRKGVYFLWSNQDFQGCLGLNAYNHIICRSLFFVLIFILPEDTSHELTKDLTLRIVHRCLMNRRFPHNQEFICHVTGFKCLIKHITNCLFQQFLFSFDLLHIQTLACIKEMYQLLNRFLFLGKHFQKTTSVIANVVVQFRHVSHLCVLKIHVLLTLSLSHPIFWVQFFKKMKIIKYHNSMYENGFQSRY